MIRNILLALACCLPFVAADVRGAAPSQPVCGPAAAGVRIVQTVLGGVPVLIRVPPRVSMPPIVLWHGFGPPDSEAALMSLLPLDDLPAVKVYAGLPLFGRRAPEDPGELARRQSEDLVTGVFGPVVMGAVRELPVMVDALRRAGCMEAGEGIGLFGFSAGGAAVLLALAEREVPVAAAVVLNASTGLPASVAAYERATGRTYAWTPETRACGTRGCHRPGSRDRGGITGAGTAGHPWWPGCDGRCRGCARIARCAGAVLRRGTCMPPGAGHRGRHGACAHRRR